MPDFRDHEDRPAVLAELHLRPFLQFKTPQRFQHFAFVIDPRGAAGEHAAFSALCESLGVAPPGADARFHRIETGPWTLRWELHAEFASYSWSTGAKLHAERLENKLHAERPDIEGDRAKLYAERQEKGAKLYAERPETECVLTDPGPWPADMALPEAFERYQPVGKLLVRVAMALLPRLDKPETIEQAFDRTSLTVVNVSENSARLATDFKADASGTVRFLIEDISLTPTRAGRLVQRVLELETYRSLALLGLSVARRAEPTVRHVEEELLRLSHAMGAASSAAANRHLLQQLTGLSALLEAQIASTAYRFGATRAYAELVRGRLDVIREAEHGGYVSVSRFLRRRFSPAIATCEAVDRRQQTLATRLDYAVDLLRTRIQSELEDQNRLLLASMNRRSRMQLRLQQTVEGLSIAAVSYYIVGLLGYVAKGLKEGGALPHGVTPEMAAGLSVPFVILGVWWMLHHARKSWSGGAEKDKSDE